MSWKSVVSLILVISFLTAIAAAPAKAQPISREPELADQIDTLFDRASTSANQQKFLSVLIFVIFGGAATYATIRGIKKFVQTY
jgi:hypothetical protein